MPTGGIFNHHTHPPVGTGLRTVRSILLVTNQNTVWAAFRRPRAHTRVRPYISPPSNPAAAQSPHTPRKDPPMNLIISFSARPGGNCDSIAGYIAAPEDKILYFREMYFHPCVNCAYDCFRGRCKYRLDDMYSLWESMLQYDKVILAVPMYCGNPCSLYFIFSERCQDFFMHNDCFEDILSRLYIIGVYGSAAESPDFIPCLEKWFTGTPYTGHVLGLERHTLGQKMPDSLLDLEQVREKLKNFL